MVGNNTLLDKLVDLLAADISTLAAVAAMHLHIAKAAFTPGPGLTLAALTEATFTGAAAKNAGIGTQTVFVDPTTGLRTIQVLEPAGGWTWLCTVTPGTPETIFGVYLTDNADAVLYAAALLTPNVTISAAGQGLSLAFARLQLLAAALI